MTIIELFSAEPSENVLAACCLKPETVVYLGSASLMTDGRISAVRSFFRKRKDPPKLLFLRVAERDYAGAGAAIRDVLAKYPDCCVEMTGGSDLLLAALGTVSASGKLSLFELDVRTQQLRVLQGAIPGVKTGPLRPLRGIPAGDYIRLCGGTLTESSYRMGDSLPLALEADVQDMWKVYRQEPEIWTKQCSVLAGLCARGGSGLTVSAELSEKPDAEHIRRLTEAKLISGYSEKGRSVGLTFRDAHVKRTLSRAGDLLELWLFLAAKSDPAFTDAIMGAKIRWTERADRNATLNEIDGLMMHGAVPVYVSCKIGSVPKEALYEVDSVAARFGGSYAAKALLCARLSGNAAGKETLRQRAADMDILLIEDVDRLSRTELLDRLRQHLRRGGVSRLKTF